MRVRQNPSHVARQSTTLAISKILLVAITQLPITRALPMHLSTYIVEEGAKSTEDPSLWIYLGVAAALVLLGGAFAGLTIALMGQDEIYLQVIQTSGEEHEKRNAAKVLKLLNKGKHWVLVTLLLSNVITNETLPIVLDRSLGGGWPAVLGSTVLIVIFGEVAPQSVCVRYGLPIGAWMSPFVLVLMYILAPIAWPTAKLLDYLLGEEHGTVYKRSGLKTLVSLHKTMGEAGQQLSTDEVTIIGAVLELKEKSIGIIMTPMEDVFTLSVDDILDEDTMDMILSAGYSRIPVHTADNDQNFVGMLLVKMLITYDPEDARPVREFALATLPETSPETSCLDIVNFFQEGKSHMVLVSENPGGDSGALGVVTLEDVIEELIGEEIIDESDVFVDVHKAIRRLAPAPRMRVPKTNRVTDGPKDQDSIGDNSLIEIREESQISADDLNRPRAQDAQPRPKRTTTEHGSPRATTLLLRRRSSAAASDKLSNTQMRIRANTPQMREHLSHLGPSNVASRPRSTRNANIKIKPGVSPDVTTQSHTPQRRVSDSVSADFHVDFDDRIVKSAGKDASDGVQAVQATVGYGTMSNGSPGGHHMDRPVNRGVQTSDGRIPTVNEPQATDDDEDEDRKTREDTKPHVQDATATEGSRTTVRSLRERRNNVDKSPGYTPTGPARSGSITENIVDINGIRKVVLEMTSSSSSNEEEGDENGDPKPGGLLGFGVSLRPGPPRAENEDAGEQGQINGRTGKKKRRRRRKNGNGGGSKPEEQPLLESSREG